MLRKLWRQALESLLRRCINETGTFSLAGAKEGVSIPFFLCRSSGSLFEVMRFHLQYDHDTRQCVVRVFTVI